jgi:hypothetical protein
MEWLFNSIREHSAIWALSVYYLFSNAVSSMPMPDENNGKFYAFLFRFFNGLAANVSRAIASKMPDVPVNLPPTEPRVFP